MKRVLCIIALIWLSGCSLGIRDDGSNAIHASSHALITYQEAYRRADAYARHCRTSTNWFKGSFDVNGNLYSDNRTGVVHISMPANGKDLERIEIAASKHGGSDVTVTAWGVGVWDAREVAAARTSIETGTPICRGQRASD